MGNTPPPPIRTGKPGTASCPVVALAILGVLALGLGAPVFLLVRWVA